MKKWLFLLPACVWLNIVTAQHSDTRLKLDSLMAVKSYFKARAFYESELNHLTEFEKLLLGCSLDNFFNAPERSNAKINLLFSSHTDQLNDSLRYTLLGLAQINYSRLYEYRLAYETVNTILKEYPQFMTADEIADQKNTNIIWEMLSGQPKQSIEIKGATRIQMIKDKAGLKNLQVSCGKKTDEFIFDTGANLSTVTQSTAKKFKMKIMKEELDVTSITGLKIKSKIAVCPVFQIGNITVKNAVFLVFPDDALAIPQIRYQIDGIIGFPVIEALNEVHITAQDEFIVPDTITDYSSHNLALDFLTPIIELGEDSYTFDSGADATMLYSTYFEKHKDDLVANYKEENYEFGGAGGSILKKGYKIPFTTSIGDQTVSLKDVFVLKEPLKQSEEFYYGNIGQDFIRKFDEMILNFEYMYIRFK